MEDELTLEKLKIVERLTGIEQSIALMSQRFTDYMERNEHSHKGMRTIIEDHNLTLEGSYNNPGLKIKVDRLEQLEVDRSTHRKIIYTSLIGLLVEHVRHLFSGQ